MIRTMMMIIMATGELFRMFTSCFRSFCPMGYGVDTSIILVFLMLFDLILVGEHSENCCFITVSTVILPCLGNILIKVTDDDDEYGDGNEDDENYSIMRIV